MARGGPRPLEQRRQILPAGRGNRRRYPEDVPEHVACLFHDEGVTVQAQELCLSEDDAAAPDRLLGGLRLGLPDRCEDGPDVRVVKLADVAGISGLPLVARAERHERIAVRKADYETRVR